MSWCFSLWDSSQCPPGCGGAPDTYECLSLGCPGPLPAQDPWRPGLWLTAAPSPRADLGGAESSHAALAVLRGALARFACVCVPVRACACAALTCRLLTEVFVCTQASELRGPPALPPLPSEPRPCLRHLSDLAVFHCLLPTDPAGPDPVPASPPLPTHAASWDSP